MKKFNVTMLTILMTVFMIAGCASIQDKEATVTAEAATSETTAMTETSEEISKKPLELTILAAASLTDVTTKLAELYKEVEPNITLTFSYGASGALQTQIEEGAPADIFLSAATKQMDALNEEGLLLADTRKDLLLNKIVLIVPKDSVLSLTSFEEAGEDTVKTIALGESEGVPVGQYAEQVFTNLGIIDAVKAKANYGSDVKQVLTWVESGEVDCGVVYATDAKLSDNVSIVCEAPEGSHKDIIYPVAIIESSTLPDEAKSFLNFLITDEAAVVFEEFGFSMK